EMRERISGSLYSSYSFLLISLMASIEAFRKSRPIPSGSLMNNTGSPSDLHCTPWYTDGKNPLPHTLLPASGNFPPDVSTTKPGRFWFSVPNPYVTQAPILGLPSRCDPVCISNCAGA